MKKYPLQIAIDGPVGAGKSTIATMLADKLDCLYIDTGAMYRSVALGVAQLTSNKSAQDFYTWFGDLLPILSAKDIEKMTQQWNNEDLVSEKVSDLSIELERPKSNQKTKHNVVVYLDGFDVSALIRNNLIAEGASLVSQYPVVREVLVTKQQLMAANTSVVMEGRDIGSRVLPQAQLKIYLDASVAERVKRKQKQMHAQGYSTSYQTTKSALVKRDKREMNRTLDPLKPTPDSCVIDSTQLTPQEVVDTICAALDNKVE